MLFMQQQSGFVPQDITPSLFTLSSVAEQLFHQQFHYRFCIRPAASHKPAGSGLTKQQISEKDD